MPTSTLPSNINLPRLQSRRGRPRKISGDRQERTCVGGTSSRYAHINGPNGLERLFGSVDDLDVKMGWDAKEQMDNDPDCSAALDTLALGATVRPVEVEPAKQALFVNEDDEEMSIEIAEFVRRCLVYLSLSHRDIRLTIFQLLREALKIGHSKAEIVLRLVEGGPDDLKLVPDRVKSKTRENSCFIIDRCGNTVGIAGYTGEYADWTDPYSINSTNMVGYANAQLLSKGWELIDSDKWLVVTNRPPGDDSPLGRSAYRPAYTPYQMKRDILPMWALALDKTAMPHLVAKMPSHEYAQDSYPLDDSGAADLTKPKIPMADALYDAYEKGRRGGITVAPHDSEVEQLYASTSGDPFLSAMGELKGMITQAILLQPLATGTDKHMARAAGQVHQDILEQAIKHVRAMGADAVKRCCFAVWVRKNFDKRYWHLIPDCSMGDVELNDFAAWARAFKDLADAGLLLPSQFPHVWAVLGLPQGSMEELLEKLAVDDALNQQLLAPTVSASGVQGPSQAQKYSVQEYGKTRMRKTEARRARRQGVLSS